MSGNNRDQECDQLTKNDFKIFKKKFNNLIDDLNNFPKIPKKSSLEYEVRVDSLVKKSDRITSVKINYNDINKVMKDFKTSKKGLINYYQEKQRYQKTNLLNIARVSLSELPHSNILAWLFESTGPVPSSQFLTKFLKTIEKKKMLNKERTSKYKVLKEEDYKNVKVYREYKNIDLLLVFEDKKIVITIENKVKADVSRDSKNNLSDTKGSQLKKYYDIVKKDFKHYDNDNFYLLTPQSLEPLQNLILIDEVHAEIRKDWTIVSYNEVYNVLYDIIQAAESKLLDDKDNNVSIELIKTDIEILKKYIESLRYSVMEIEEKTLETLCNNFYTENSAMFNMINSFSVEQDILKEKYLETMYKFIQLPEYEDILEFRTDIGSSKTNVILLKCLSNDKNKKTAISDLEIFFQVNPNNGIIEFRTKKDSDIQGILSKHFEIGKNYKEIDVFSNRNIKQSFNNFKDYEIEKSFDLFKQEIDAIHKSLGKIKKVK